MPASASSSTSPPESRRDSRAAPEMIFDSGPGEVFVLRNVANLVPTYQPDGGQHGTSAAIEFAVKALNIANMPDVIRTVRGAGYSMEN